MSRRIIALTLVALVAAGIVVAQEKAAKEKPWFDMNCGMCKPMADKPGLMDNMQWEQHKLTNGIIAVTNVPKGHLEAYRAAHEEMMKIAEGMEKGEMVEMCGSCMALGMCLMKGPHEEYVKTKTGDIWIVTSDDPEVVTGLHKWVDRNKAEMEKMKPKKG